MKVSEAIDRLRLIFLDRGSSQTTWKTDYWKVLKHLPPDAEVTTDLLIQLVERTTRNTKSRTRYLMVTTQLAQVAQIPWNPDPLKPQRGRKSKIDRAIPTDRQIVDFWKSIENPAWAWVVGIMATYGLRNHEVFFCKPSPYAEGAIEVTEGKTGSRTTFPLYPQWVERFDLANRFIPNIDLNREHDAIGHSVTEYFSRINAPFRPYDLRHAWAIRGHLVFRLPEANLAQCLGHSIDVHRKIYLKWITIAQTQAALNSAPKVEAPL